MPRDLPSGTVTFFFSDIESSTTLVRALGDDYAKALETQQQIIRAALAAHDGIELGTEGDSFFAVFASAKQAVRAAADAQRELQRRYWPHGHPVRVRMGLHTGEGTRGGDNYVGLDVHRAARIAGAAHGDQVLVSHTTRGLTERDLSGEIRFLDLGDHRLKDLTRTERLHQLGIPGLTDQFPPIASLTASARNLPSTLTSFVGRDVELREIGDLLTRVPVVTVAGPGGVGKTRLAIELGRSHVSDFADGVTYVQLAHLREGDALAAEAAAALGVLEQADRSATRTVADHLSNREMLLVLDNCEHLIEAAGSFVADVIRRSPGTTVLATSREPLGTEGEHVYRVGPLPVPDTDPSSTEDILSLEVVALFSDRARAASAGFDPGDHAADILAICRKLAGIPMAIELAAARTTALAPAQILERLEDHLMTQGSAGTISPHQTLEAAIEWSHDLLTDGEARLFRRISVFEGGFDAHAAEGVCADDALPAEQIVDTLSGLIAKSLVNTSFAARRARYTVFEPIRQYAGARLEEHGETATWISRHGAYFLEWARARAADLRTHSQLDALQSLETDHQNLLAALSRAFHRKDRSVALDIAATLTWFWYLHTHVAVGELWAERLLDDDSPPSHSSVRLTIGAGEFDYLLGHNERADRRLRKAVEDARVIGSRSLEMWALSHLATKELRLMSIQKGVEYARATLAVAGEVGSIGAAAYAEFLLAGVEAMQAYLEGSLDRSTASGYHDKLAPLIEAVRGLGDRNMIGHVLQLTGFIASAVDDADARSELDEALTAFGDLRGPGCAAHCLEMVALVLSRTKPEGSMSLLSAAETLRASAGVVTSPFERQIAVLAREAASESIDPERQARAWVAGADITVAEAVALGRSLLAGYDHVASPQ